MLQKLSSLSLGDEGIYLRDCPFWTNIGIVKLHPTKGTHWFAYKNEIFLIVLVAAIQTNFLGPS